MRPNSSLKRSLGGLLLGLGLPVLGACSGDPGGYSNINEQLAPLATAELVPGQGLGPIRPGETTLWEAVQSYGTGSVSILFGDEVTAIELAYASNQLYLQFQIPGEQAYNLATPLTQAGRDLEVYLNQEPELKELELSGLAICVPINPRKDQAPWWQGSLGRAKLGGTLSDLTASMAGLEHREVLPVLIPGQNSNLPASFTGFPEAGVYAHFSDPTTGRDLVRFASDVVDDVESESLPSVETLQSATAIGEPRILRLTQMAPTHY